MNCPTFQSVLSTVCQTGKNETLKKGTINHPRDGSTRESYSNASKVSSAPRASLWRITGTSDHDCEQLCQETDIVIKDQEVSTKCSKTGKHYSFSIAQTQNMQRHMVDCVQWTCQGEEYGYLFVSANDAAKFCKEYFDCLSQEGEELYHCEDCEVVQYDSCVEKFSITHNQVECTIQRCSGNNTKQEYYIFGKSKDEICFVARLDEETSFFINQSERVVGCWLAISVAEDQANCVTGIRFRSQQEMQACWNECCELKQDESPKSNKAFMSFCSKGGSLEAVSRPMSNTTTSQDYTHEALLVSKNTVYAAKTHESEQTSQLHCYKLDSNGGRTLVAQLSSQEFKSKPTCMQSQEGGSKIVYNDKCEQSKISVMDAQTQKIVSTWKGANQIRGMCRWQPTSADNTVLCFNEKQMFALDTRQKEMTESLTYTVNPRFTCTATTADGGIVMGSSQGMIRMYDGKTGVSKQLKRAKTQLEVGSAPILDVTTTKDGSWVLATCPKYLALVPVKVPGEEQTAFTKAMRRETPTPVILKVKVEDIIKHNLSDVKFQTGKFDALDSTIIACTGTLVFLWNFGEIQRGGEPRYRIESVNDSVANVEHFCSQEIETLVVATPGSVESVVLKRLDNYFN